MEEYHDLELTIAAFTDCARRARVPRGRGRDRAPGVPARCVRGPAAAGRVGRHPLRRPVGAEIKIRLVKGANLAMETGRRGHARLGAGAVPHQGSRPTPTTSDAWIGSLRPTGWSACGSGWRATTCSTSRGPACSRRLAGSPIGSSSRCSRAWRRPRAATVRDATDGLLLYTPVVGARRLRRGDQLSVPPARGERSGPGNFLRSLFSLKVGTAEFDVEAETLPGRARRTATTSRRSPAAARIRRRGSASACARPRRRLRQRAPARSDGAGRPRLAPPPRPGSSPHRRRRRS